ncbi:MAG: DUF3078 domain-containing protein [Marinilabiliales bacterium]|nr:DUF3078 domain-containing protein [Marinilabiliales bacterium]
MGRKKWRYLWIISLILTVSDLVAHAATLPPEASKGRSKTVSNDTLTWSVNLIKRIIHSPGEWYLTKDEWGKPVKGIYDYAVNDPVDTLVVRMRTLLAADTLRFFNRKAENIPNKRNVPGYLFAEELENRVAYRSKSVTDSLRRIVIPVPESYLADGLANAPLLKSTNPMQTLAALDSSLPDAFRRKFYKGWSSVRLPALASAAETDSMRVKILAWTLQTYNDSILFHRRDSLMAAFRENSIKKSVEEATTRQRNYLMQRNRDLLNAYNEAEIAKTNDSVRFALGYLTSYAALDSLPLSLSNLSGNKSRTWTANRPMMPIRIFLKNEQNDSLGVVIYNLGKGEIKLVIDDGVKLMRFAETQKKEIMFRPKKPENKLQSFNFRHVEGPAWKLLGTGSVGFTQTSLSNWAKGGESSLSLLLIGRYTADYTKNHVKWENLAEFRLGIFNSKTRGLEKNDDKIEFQSRFGYSTAKKWYISAETNFRTQMANGYKYPDKVNPISAFMSPAYLTFSLGMDYKPNKNFSLFLSPLTSKTTSVRDTALIDVTTYGIEKGKTRLWEPGAIVKMNWHKQIIDEIGYDTRAEIFNSYKYPFSKYNVDWEQTLMLNVTRHISTRINTQLIYDYNVKFPVLDANGVEIAKQAKWQFKELFTVGFNYKF